MKQIFWCRNCWGKFSEGEINVDGLESKPTCPDCGELLEKKVKE